MRSEVVLIGPVTAGKSTVGALVSQSLGLPHVDMDKVGDAYYESAGFPLAELDRRMFEDFYGAYRWAKSSLPFALESVLREYSNCVFSLGALHTHYSDEGLYERARLALAEFEHVVLLLPSDDPDRSIEVLRERSLSQRGMSWVFDGYDFFDHWVRDSCNARVATRVIYTEGKTPEQTAAEVLRLVAG